jgi:hypothetical protein
MVYRKRFPTGFAKIAFAFTFAAFLNGFLAAAEKTARIFFLNIIGNYLINFS